MTGIKLLILGNARHGKDTMAEMLQDEFGLTFTSSSERAAEIFIYDALKDKYGYTSPEECFIDRMNHRPEWFDMICDYNKEDGARLAKDILAVNDCYVGMRNIEELNECKKQKLFDLIVWVDASERLPLEGSDSMNITKEDADIIVTNNGTYDEFKVKVRVLGNIFKKCF